MKQKQKIIIFISFLSISGISYFSWRTIAKDNRQPIAHQEEKKKDLPGDHQENNRFLFWIIIVIILLLATTIIIYVFIKRNGDANGNSTKTNNLPDGTETKPNENDSKKNDILNNFQDNSKPQNGDHNSEKGNDNNPKDEKNNPPKNNNLNGSKNLDNNDDHNSNHISNSSQPKPEEDEDEKKYSSWKCGVRIVEAKNEVQIIFCEQWSQKNQEDFVKKIFYNDVEAKLNIKDDHLKAIYEDANGKNKEKIIGFLNLCFNLLKHINFSFLKKIEKIKDFISKTRAFRIFIESFNEHKNKNVSNLVLYQRSISTEENEITENEDYKNKDYKDNFTKKNSLELFKGIRKAYCFTHSYNDNGKKTDYLFNWSFTFYILIWLMKRDFKTLFRTYNNEYENVAKDEVAQITKEIEEIENFLK